MKFPKNYFPSQPRSVWALNALEACEAFSFYGLGSILMLFMKRELCYSDSQAIGIYALYMAMTEVFSLIGGILADRLFGLKKCVVIGAYIMLAGYIFVALLPYNLFYLGIGFIVMGSGLFASNSSTLLGLCYDGPNDPRRNIGVLLYIM